MKKTFVLDTNVLLHNAESIECFDDNDVVLPMAVIEELDRFKSQNDELGRNARQVIRRLDELRAEGNLRDGVPISNGGRLRIVPAPPNIAEMDLAPDVPDNRILRLAYDLSTNGSVVVFVTKDINARLKADALGLRAVDFEKQKIKFDELYSGYAEATVSPELMDSFFESTTVEGCEIGGHPNQFVMLREENNLKRTGLARVVEPGTLRHFSTQSDTAWGVVARNKEQRMALELLMDPAVTFVTLVGKAGTGKTLLALAAALHATLRLRRYDHILVSRPIIPMGKDIGYLPGAKGEKISHWMQPIFDNLAFLLREDAEPPTKTKRKTRTSPQEKIEKLIRDNVLELEALTYMRGRSIPRQYVIIDEAQNLTPHEVKTIVSRAGEGTKMVLTGDPYQIDNPYLDASSNGLTYAAERMKDESVHGHVILHESERSQLAAIAAELL